MRRKKLSPSPTPTIAFAAGAEEGDVYVVDAAGGAPELLAGGSGDESAPSWSADGEWLYFASNQSGSEQIWKVPAGGGEPIQVTTHGGYRPVESPDGRFLYYVKREPGATHGAPLWRINAANGEEEQVFETPIFHPENFDVIGDEIYYSTESQTPGSKGLRRYNIQSGEDTEVAQIGPSLSTGLSVSADGRTAYYSHLDSQEADLVMFDVPPFSD